MSQQTFLFANTTNATPMMKQYLDIKAVNQDSILFYRMGDFYEMFFEDATIASPILGIALTKRGQHLGEDIPMCGVPFHSCDSYIERLIEKGYKVAICEQMESPEEAKKRGYKAVVRREVVRIITPGTVTEDSLLGNSAANFLLAVSGVKDNIALAWTDISTGEFYTTQTNIISLNNDISRIDPKEILINDKLYSEERILNSLADFRRIVTIQANNLFDLKRSEHKIKQYYGIITHEALGSYSQSELIACGVILEYIELTQKTNSLKISIPKQINNAFYMSIDSATRRNLELTISTSGERNNTLLSVLNKTKTSMGFRLLNQYLASPLIDVSAINRRLDLIEFFIRNVELSTQISSLLPAIGDIERSLTRLYLNRGGPRDLYNIKQSLKAADNILACFSYFKGDLIDILQNHLANLGNFDALTNELEDSLTDELPALARDGGFIKRNYNPKLDQLYDLKNNSKEQLALLKQKYITETGINSLKINYNNVLGYFIDVTPQHINKIKDEQFIHRQTLANSVRYTTMELRALESELINVSDNILKLELELYDHLVAKIIEKADQLTLFAHSIAAIDVAISLANLASENNYVRPHIEDSRVFNIEGGRHPVIEQSIKLQKQQFIANNCLLSDIKRISVKLASARGFEEESERKTGVYSEVHEDLSTESTYKSPAELELDRESNIWLVTGPNMAGKSTFLRQNALIAIMAQMGSFVPASSATIGIIDKIYSRVGAADDIARGRSTFMVEMVETANILNNATDKSFIILDEIGRGTSTYDGVSIASACLEFIHNKLKCRALFATHYHELSALKDQLKSLACYTMQIKEWQNKVIFMHKIIPGTADKSYGIHVAAMAGLPVEVIKRAEAVLQNLEKDHTNAMEIDLKENISLPSMLEKTLFDLDVDELSPKQALEMLYNLKKMV